MHTFLVLLNVLKSAKIIQANASLQAFILYMNVCEDLVIPPDIYLWVHIPQLILQIAKKIMYLNSALTIILLRSSYLKHNLLSCRNMKKLSIHFSISSGLFGLFWNINFWEMSYSNLFLSIMQIPIWVIIFLNFYNDFCTYYILLK